MSEIKVTIQDERGSIKTTSNSVSSVNQTNMTKPTADIPSTAEGKANAKTSNGMLVASMIASRSFNYITCNVGKWSGNTRNQERVNMIQQGVTLATSFGVNPVLGIATAAMQIGTTAVEAHYNNFWEEKRAADRRLRAGYVDNKAIGGRK